MADPIFTPGASPSPAPTPSSASAEGGAFAADVALLARSPEKATGDACPHCGNRTLWIGFHLRDRFVRGVETFHVAFEDGSVPIVHFHEPARGFVDDEDAADRVDCGQCGLMVWHADASPLVTDPNVFELERRRRALVDTLRSGEFQQISGLLGATSCGLCVMGVACVVYERQTGDKLRRWPCGIFHPDAGRQAVDWFGFVNEVGSYDVAGGAASLVQHNDSLGPSHLDFAGLADLIESCPPGLFAEGGVARA